MEEIQRFIDYSDLSSRLRFREGWSFGTVTRYGQLQDIFGRWQF